MGRWDTGWVGISRVSKGQTAQKGYALTALRLYLRDAGEDLAERVSNLRGALERLTGRQGDLLVRGYKHMHHAMGSSVDLWGGGFDEAFADAVGDVDGQWQAAVTRRPTARRRR